MKPARKQGGKGNMVKAAGRKGLLPPTLTSRFAMFEARRLVKLPTPVPVQFIAGFSAGESPARPLR